MHSVKSTAIFLAGLTFCGFLLPINGEANNAFGLSPDVIHYSSNPSLYNVAGENISSIEVGQQSVVRITVHNNNAREEAFVILVEVRDGNGITRQLSWQSGRIAANADYTMETSWMPDEDCSVTNNECRGNYEIRSFAITSLNDPHVLSAVSSAGGIKVTGSLPVLPSNHHRYELSLNNNQTYGVDYSFSSGDGRITRIDFNEKIRMMVLSITTSQDSRLTITMSAELMQYAFPVDVYNGNDLEGFVDGISVPLDQTTDEVTGHVKFVIPVEQGAEEIEIVGSYIP